MVKASFPLSLSLFRLPPAWKVVPPASSLFIRTYSVAGIVVSGKSLLPPLPAQKLHIGVEAARREGGRGERILHKFLPPRQLDFWKRESGLFSSYLRG